MLTTFSLASFSAAAKSLQSRPTLCDPHRQQPTRLPHLWDSPGKKTGVGCHFLLRPHSLCCSIIGLSFSLFHIQTLHKKIRLGEFFPLQERIYLLTKFYSQVTSQKSIQPEYERRTVAQGQKVMTAVQGSSCVRLCLQKGRTRTWPTVRALRPGQENTSLPTAQKKFNVCYHSCWSGES